MRNFLLLISLLLPSLVTSVAGAAEVAGVASVAELVEAPEAVNARLVRQAHQPVVSHAVDFLVAELVEAPVVQPAYQPEADTLLFPFTSSSADRYSVAITFGSVSLSGICVVKRQEGRIAGSVVNEFGIRAFDFTMTPDRRRVKLLNITKPLDRCLVRKAIRADLRKLFTATSADDYVTLDGETVVMRLRGRSYAFTKMKTR